MDDLEQRLKRNLTKAVKAKKTTFEQVAIEVEMDKGNLSKMLNGKKKMNLDTLKKIAEALDVDIHIFFKP